MRKDRPDQETSGELARFAGVPGAFVIVLVFAALFAAGAWLGDGESLFLAPWWLRIVQLAFSAGMVTSAWFLAKMLPPVRDKNGHPQTPAYGAAWLAFVWCCMMSHAVIRGGLRHTGIGTPETMRCIVAVSGTRHERSSGEHRDCVTIDPKGRDPGYHLNTHELFALLRKEHPDYPCSQEDAQTNDTIELVGRRSFLGFAAVRMRPVSDRLLQACTPGA